MPKYYPRSNTTAERSRIAVLFLPFAIALGSLVACRSPLQAGGARADCSLNVIVSASSRYAARAASGAPGGNAPRLILPTAIELTVTLSPADGNPAEPVSRTVPLAPDAEGYVKASVEFRDIVVGVYEVDAAAMDAAGAVLFRQSSTLDMAASGEPVTLSLAPADPGSLAVAAGYSISATLPANASRSWRLLAGSELVSSGSLFLSGLGSGGLYFLQEVTGETLASGPAQTRVDCSALPRDRELYLTLYNGGGSQVDVSAFAGPIQVAVPAGTLQYGVLPTSTNYVSAFSMGKYEVTRAQFLAVMGTDPSDSAVSPTQDCPAQRINSYHAIAFCNKLSLMEGLTPVYSVSVGGTPVNWSSLLFAAIPVSADDDWKAATFNYAANGYRLPTDMEWMWAAMGATSDRANGYAGTGINTKGYTKGYAGSTEIGDAQVALDNYAWTQVTSQGTTHPAGTKLPNELALYDMSGNVFEWCWNWYDTVPTGALSNYQGLASGNTRGAKSGSYSNSIALCKLWQEIGSPPSWVNSSIGLRVARSTQPLFQVIYDANGATGGTVPIDTNAYQTGDTAQVLANTGTLLKTGSAFAGWNTRADGNGVDYIPYGGLVTVGSAPVLLYAQWLSDYTSPNVGALKAVPVGSYQRDATATSITRIRQAYLMSATEITRDQWTAVTGSDPVVGSSSGTEDPVQNVNWYHAIAFCNKLSIKEGLTPIYSVTVSGLPVNFATLTFAAVPTGAANADWNAASADWSANGYRLPTEMEWAWAAMGATNDARAGDIVSGHNSGGYSKGYAGSTESGSAYVNLGDFAWYDTNSTSTTHPAGNKIANELGLYDMSGNVCEWMWDPYSNFLPTGLVNSDSDAGRGGSGDVQYRVKTGGSWNYPYGWCPVAFRINESPYAQISSIGFRVVRP